jgi:hypothetical protein
MNPEAVDALLQLPPYSLPQAEKEAALLPVLTALVAHHRRACPAYAAILDATPARPPARLADLPFIPVRLFKHHTLASVPPEAQLKVLTSSGTTGQVPSRVILDRETAALQTRAVVRIMQDFLGKARTPMLLVEAPGVVGARDSFSARGAGVLGLSNLGRDHTWLLADGTMALDLDALDRFLARWPEGPILLFGFTFMVWKHLVQALEARGTTVGLGRGVLVHSGGWKRLQDEAVGGEAFRARLAAVTGITRVYDFYGMVEQVGSIFVACEADRLHAPVFAEVLVRRATDWSEAELGEAGVLEVLSALPRSYPGHALLTEDLGVLLGVDDCPCGRKGRTFRVLGRLPRAETRGCSDTYGGRPSQSR